MLGSIDTTAAAYGSYDPATNHVSYFAVLKIETNPSYSDEDQMYAAGYLEGALTSNDSYMLWQNLLSTFGWASNQPPSCIADFFVTQDEYIRAMIATAADNRAFWDALGLIMNQYDGLIAGYNATAPADQGLSTFAFAAMSAIGDLGDVGNGACPSLRPNFDNMTQQEFEQYVNLHGHCSSLVKLTGDFSQLYMAHVTWSSYQSMNRIYKHCTLLLLMKLLLISLLLHYDVDNFQTSIGEGKQMSFSSYPATLASIDDFYIMGPSELVMVRSRRHSL